MGRDVEKDCTTQHPVESLRRIADAMERGEAFRIQVAGTRFRHPFTVPARAALPVEHAAEAGEHELEFQLKWTDD